MKISKLKDQTISRDLRKLRSNPQFFLNRLSNVDWSILVNIVDVDEMEEFWTTEINKCLDSIAPWKTRKLKKKKYCLPKIVLEEMKK